MYMFVDIGLLAAMLAMHNRNAVFTIILLYGCATNTKRVTRPRKPNDRIFYGEKNNINT